MSRTVKSHGADFRWGFLVRMSTLGARAGKFSRYRDNKSISSFEWTESRPNQILQDLDYINHPRTWRGSMGTLGARRRQRWSFTLYHPGTGYLITHTVVGVAGSTRYLRLAC